jgi:quercetin dioxygenase-like cupin family protein
MSKIETLQADALSGTPSSPCITRHLAFEGDGCRVVRSRVGPGVSSGWHHHADYDVYGYVVSGAARLESKGEEEEAVTLGPGDFLHVPPHTIHREVNPSSEEGEVILFLRGSGPLVVNVDDGDRG